MATLNSNIPAGALSQKWEKYKFNTKLINCLLYTSPSPRDS